MDATTALQTSFPRAGTPARAAVLFLAVGAVGKVLELWAWCC